jgi:mannose-6-phosphate isomerase-like protein (cupin superfamily)
MTIDSGPHDIDTTAFILGPDGAGTSKTVTPTFYQELGEEFPDFRGHVLIQRFTFSDPWPTWEVHPEGDEFVYLIEGDTDFVLMVEGNETTLRVSDPGSYVVVPRGTWHTARPHAPTTMLFVTPGEGTLNAETPG